MFLKLGNYYFHNYNGKKILLKEEKELTINLISNEKDNKMYVNIVKYNKPIQSSKFISYKNNLLWSIIITENNIYLNIK